MKIVVGYDGSNVAADALNLAKEHAKAFNATVYVVCSQLGGPNEKFEDVQKGKRDLEYAKSLFETDKIPCETHLIIRGLTPGEDIVSFAKQINAYEIIIGVKRRSKVGKLIFGSTAQYVILEAECPVVTVK